MVPSDGEHDVKFILHIVPLHRSKAHFYRHLLAAVVLGEDIILLDPQGADGVAVDRQQIVDEIVLDTSGLVPRGVTVLAGFRSDVGLDLQHAARVAPCMGKAVHDDHAVRADLLHGGIHAFLVMLRRVGRFQLDVPELADAQICAVGVQLAAPVLSIDETDL